MNKILETNRLVLREFNISDAAFILVLVNTKDWLEFIGDKNIKTIKDAQLYLQNTLLKSYHLNGYGLWLVCLKDSQTPIGMCGLVNRETLNNTDIGFAMLPEFYGLGYGYESANATLNFAKNNLNIKKIIAITDSRNIASINLLNKLGLFFDKTQRSSDDKVLIFSQINCSEDRGKLDKLVTEFYNTFTNTGDQIPNVKKIKKIFIRDGMIINNTKRNPEIYTLDEFIFPRQQILNNGTLLDFSENEISHTTEIYKNIAQRFSLYEKSGILNSIQFESTGMKTFQFIKTHEEWKISSVTWSDEKQNQ